MKGIVAWAVVGFAVCTVAGCGSSQDDVIKERWRLPQLAHRVILHRRMTRSQTGPSGSRRAAIYRQG